MSVFPLENKNDIIKEFIPTDAVRFCNLETDCSDCKNKDEIFEKISDTIALKPKGNLYEINLCGMSEAYEELNNSENLLCDFAGNYTGNVYKINNKTIPPANENIFIENEGVLGILARCTEENSEINISEIYDNISELNAEMLLK